MIRLGEGDLLLLYHRLRLNDYACAIPERVDLVRLHNNLLNTKHALVGLDVSLGHLSLLEGLHLLSIK